MPTVFISYSWNDQKNALRLRDALSSWGYDVWMDIDNIQPGHSISDKIAEGLDASDYYVLCISESSNASSWVKRELAFAIALADKNKLTAIPFLMGNVEVPFEFSGLLYIDARRDFDEGLTSLFRYLEKQSESSYAPVFLPSPGPPPKLLCDQLLLSLKRGDLRFHMTERLSLSAIEILWYDLFERKMEDEVRIKSLALSVIEVLERTDQKRQLSELVRLICRNHPEFADYVRAEHPEL